MFSAHLERTKDNGRQTWGILTIFNEQGQPVWRCYTLELPWKNNDPVTSCYPPGRYRVVRRWSLAHSNHFHVLVPNRAVRLFHVGNYVASVNPKTKVPDTKGCTLVGYSYGDITGDGQVEILRSAQAMADFLQVIPGDSFDLLVTAP